MRVHHLDSVTLGIFLELPFQYILKFIECVVNVLGPFSNDRLVGRAHKYRFTRLVERRSEERRVGKECLE